jgi:hypothetical protein
MTLLLELCQITLVKVNEHAEVVRETIFEAMELRAIENGLITRHQIVNILDEFRNGIRDNVRQQIDLIQGVPGLVRQPGRNAAGVDANRGQGTLYTYNGRFWDVPQAFAFPASVKRDDGWRLWLQGMPAYTTVGENGVVEYNKIKAFRVLFPAWLQRKIAEAYKLHWRSLYRMMEKGVGNIPEELSPEIVNNLYNLGTEYLRTKS